METKSTKRILKDAQKLKSVRISNDNSPAATQTPPVVAT